MLSGGGSVFSDVVMDECHIPFIRLSAMLEIVHLGSGGLGDV